MIQQVLERPPLQRPIGEWPALALAATWRTILIAAAILDRALEDLALVVHLHALQHRPLIAAHSPSGQGALVVGLLRTFAGAADDRKALEDVHAFTSPKRKYGPAAGARAAELYGEALVAADLFLGIWLRRRARAAGDVAAPEKVDELPEPTPDPNVARIFERLDKIAEAPRALARPDLEEVEELRDRAGELVANGASTGIVVVHKLLGILAKRRPTEAQTALVARTLEAIMNEDEKPITRPLGEPSLSIARLGEVLGTCEPKATKRWLRDRKVPLLRPGRTIRVQVADLEKRAGVEWLAHRQRYETG